MNNYQVKETNNFKIESLGIQEEWVYDLEVDKVHNFFANDILISNSTFFNISDLIDANFPDDSDYHKIADFIINWDKEVLTPYVKEKCQELADYMNAYENKFNMKREKIITRAILRAKKNYIINIIDSEGVRYPNPKFSATGVEYVKSQFPDYIKPKMKECYTLMLEHDTNNPNINKRIFQDFVKQTKEEFFKQEPETIPRITKMSDMDKFLDSKGNLIEGIGATRQVKASVCFNQQLDKTGLYKSVRPIQNGDKIKYIHLKTPNPFNSDVIGFTEYLPRELKAHEYLDYQTQFEKVFYNPIKSFANLLNWEMETKVDARGLFKNRPKPIKSSDVDNNITTNVELKNDVDTSIQENSHTLVSSDNETKSKTIKKSPTLNKLFKK